MRKIPRPLFISLAIAGVSLCIPASAQTYQWDTNGSAAGLGGGGTWNGVNTFWDTVGVGADDGTDATVAYTFTGSDTAIFGGTPGTVPSQGTYNGSVTISSDGYLFSYGNANGDVIFTGLVTMPSGGLTTFGTAGAGFGDFKFNGGIDLNGGSARVNNRNGSGAQGSIASVTGNGTLYIGSSTRDTTINGNNTGFSGSTVIENGNTVAGNDGAFGTSTITVSGGNLYVNAKTLSNDVVLNGGGIRGIGGTISGNVSESGGPRSLTVATNLTLTNTTTYYQSEPELAPVDPE
jgi:fibronectin-binding autotransporter adhesin